MNPKRRAFVNAYLSGTTQGNATQSALAAGYSPDTAYSQGSRLLKDAEVAQAIETRFAKAEFTVDQSLREVAELAQAPVDKVTASDKLQANKLFLQVRGALKEHNTGSRITVNIGFLTPSGPASIDAVVMPQVMPSRTLVEDSGE